MSQTTPAASVTTPAAAATTPMAEASSPAAAAAGGLSGTWKGQYSGQYSGTFNLSWTQTGNTLAGTITITSPASTLDLNGTLNGNTITFGTVGSAAITYTGTVSGNSMSGSWQISGGPAAAGGTWSANRAS